MAIKRIPPNAIHEGKPYRDGEIITGTMVNEVVKVLKDGVNYNKFFIDAMFSGTTEEAIVIGVPRWTNNDVSEDIAQLESYIISARKALFEGLKAFVFRCVYEDVDDNVDTPPEITGVVALNYYKWTLGNWVHQYPVSMDKFIQGLSADFSDYNELITLDDDDLFIVQDISASLPKKVTKLNLKETIGVNNVHKRVDYVLDGTTPAKKAEQDRYGNDIINTYETKSDATSKLALKADKTYVDAQDQALDDYFEGEITKIKDGTTIVKKAEQDANGNVITTTYETKADATSKLATKVDKTQKIIGIDLQDDILIGEFKTALGNATQSVAGLLSAEDKTHLDGLVALLESSDGDTIVDTIGEILAIFNNYPEGADLVTVLNGKVDKVVGKGLSTNDLTDVLKNNYDVAYTHSQVKIDNPHEVKFSELLQKPTTRDGYGITDVYTKPETYTQQEINALFDNLSSVKGVKSTLLTPTELSDGGTISTNLLTNDGVYIVFTAIDTSTEEIDSDTVPVSTITTGKKFVFFDNQEIVFTIGSTTSTFQTTENVTLKINLLYLDNGNVQAVDIAFDGSLTNYLLNQTNVKEAIEKIDNELKTANDNSNAHTNNTNNPHSVTKAQVGLENVDNTSDLDKPISTLTQNALNDKSNVVHTHTKSEVGLGSVENYAIATQAEAEAGTATDKYMTPLRTAQAIAELAGEGGGETLIAEYITGVNENNIAFTYTYVKGKKYRFEVLTSAGDTTSNLVIKLNSPSQNYTFTKSRLVNTTQNITTVTSAVQWVVDDGTVISGEKLFTEFTIRWSEAGNVYISGGFVKFWSSTNGEVTHFGGMSQLGTSNLTTIIIGTSYAYFAKDCTIRIWEME